MFTRAVNHAGSYKLLLACLVLLAPASLAMRTMRGLPLAAANWLSTVKTTDSIFEDETCIATPKEFVQAFINRENKCVANNILVRLQSDNGWGGAPNARALFANRLKARPVTFFSYDDTPAKYLRFGSPLDLGDYNEKKEEGGDADATFEGLESVSNFLALLEQVGYDAPSSFISGTYAMVVTTRPAQQPLDNSFIPTWKNVVAYYSRYLSWVAQDPTFKLEEEIVAQLSGKAFGELTGCPTSCTFEDLEFPNLPTSPRPAIYGSRINATACKNPNATRFLLTEPTGFDDWEVSCGQPWKDAKAFVDRLCTNGNNATVIKAMGSALVTQLKSLATIEEKAMFFRAYLNTACGGTFNTLFSGNGFTYTGTGGLMSPTGKEILLGASPHLNMDNDVSLLGEVDFVYFCSSGEISQDPDFKCPTSK